MMIPNGHTKILGLIGSSIEESHSLRFTILPYILSVSMQCTCHSKAPIPTWESLFQLDNFLGANVTMPYKECLLPHMDILTERAERIGAINTIHKKDGQLIGDNTDSVGFLSALRTQLYRLEKSTNLYIGCRWSSESHLYALDSVGVECVHVWNRNAKRIQSLNGLGLHIQVLGWFRTIGSSTMPSSYNVHHWDSKVKIP